MGHSLSRQVPRRSHCARTCVLKKVGRMGGEIWGFISLPVSSAPLMGELQCSWYQSEAGKIHHEELLQPQEIIFQMYMHLKGVQERQDCAGKGVINKSHQSTGSSSPVAQGEGHKPRVTHGGLACHCIPQHCHPSADLDGSMWMLLFCLSPSFLDLGPLWSSSSLISMCTNFLAHKIRCGYFMG